jgi:hypothetical protein
VSHGGSYEEVVERARAAAAAKRLSGEVPEGTGAALDRLFLEVAPGGARPEGEGLEALVEMLARYRYDPSIAVASGPGLRGTVAGLAKRALRPVTVWTLRHLTDQLNAYHLAETELLRAIVQTSAAERGDRGAPGESGASG